MIKKFVKKPELATAIKYTGENKAECVKFTNDKAYGISEIGDDGQEWVLILKDGESIQKAKIGDYIVKDLRGSFSFYTEDLFNEQFMEDKDGNIYEVYIKVKQSDEDIKEESKDEFIGDDNIEASEEVEVAEKEEATIDDDEELPTTPTPETEEIKDEDEAESK